MELPLEVEKKVITDKCLNCIHRQAKNYTNTSYSYCKKKKQANTANGFKKIKAKDTACSKFQKGKGEVIYMN